MLAHCTTEMLNCRNLQFRSWPPLFWRRHDPSTWAWPHWLRANYQWSPDCKPCIFSWHSEHPITWCRWRDEEQQQLGTAGHQSGRIQKYRNCLESNRAKYPRSLLHHLAVQRTCYILRHVTPAPSLSARDPTWFRFSYHVHEPHDCWSALGCWTPFKRYSEHFYVSSASLRWSVHRTKLRFNDVSDGVFLLDHRDWHRVLQRCLAPGPCANIENPRHAFRCTTLPLLGNSM